MFNAEQIAEVCHEANRAITKHINDVPVQPTWPDAPEEMRTSSIQGVNFAIAHPEATPEDQHREWCKGKERDGWTYSAVKDPVAKTHPALVPYDQLSEAVRRKDALFRAVVAALK